MTEIVTNEASLMVKQFENLNITIYGTYENPLFKAKDIGDLLCIKNVRDTILKLKSTSVVPTLVINLIRGFLQKMVFMNYYLYLENL